MTSADSDWDQIFPDDSSREAYQQAMRRLTPLDWTVLESSQGDLLDLLIGRVSADTGSAAILALAMMFRDRDRADERSLELLQLIMMRIAPRRAKTILVSLALAWRSAVKQPLDRGPRLLEDELRRTVRRLLLAEIDQPERAALLQIRRLVEGES